MKLLDAMVRAIDEVKDSAIALRLRELLRRFAREEAERFLESALALYKVAGTGAVAALDRMVANAARAVKVPLSPAELAVLRRVLLRVLEQR